MYYLRTSWYLSPPRVVQMQRRRWLTCQSGRRIAGSQSANRRSPVARLGEARPYTEDAHAHGIWKHTLITPREEKIGHRCVRSFRPQRKAAGQRFGGACVKQINFLHELPQLRCFWRCGVKQCRCQHVFSLGIWFWPRSVRVSVSVSLNANANKKRLEKSVVQELHPTELSVIFFFVMATTNCLPAVYTHSIHTCTLKKEYVGWYCCDCWQWKIKLKRDTKTAISHGDSVRRIFNWVKKPFLWLPYLLHYHFHRCVPFWSHCSASDYWQCHLM